MDNKDREKIEGVKLVIKNEDKYKSQGDILTLLRIVKYCVNTPRDILRDYETKIKEKIFFAEEEIRELDCLEPNGKETSGKSKRIYKLKREIIQYRDILNQIPSEIKKIVKRGEELFKTQAPKIKGTREIIPGCALLGKCNEGQKAGDICTWIDNRDDSPYGFPVCDNYLKEAARFIENGVYDFFKSGRTGTKNKSSISLERLSLDD